MLKGRDKCMPKTWPDNQTVEETVLQGALEMVCRQTMGFAKLV